MRMSRQVTALIVGVIASLALVAGTMQGCGSSSSGGNNVALCQQACDKALECTPDAGSEGQAIATQCKQNCSTQTSTTHCSNETAIANAFKACLPMACSAYLSCLGTIPACQQTTGAGGSGGSTGSGGAGGGAAGDCSTCTKADSCCTATVGQTCNLAQSCTAATGSQQSQIIMGCQQILTTAQGQATVPAECR
jgi:hypothetical protein